MSEDGMEIEEGYSGAADYYARTEKARKRRRIVLIGASAVLVPLAAAAAVFTVKASIPDEALVQEVNACATATAGKPIVRVQDNKGRTITRIDCRPLPPQ